MYALWLGALAFSLGVPPQARAQDVTRPAQAWRTIRTQHFDFHTPATLEEWTRHVASRMEAYAAAVNALVGHRPGGRVTVLVDDPSATANGFAVPLLGSPVIMLWPTPPGPSLTLGEHRGWGEILGIHEYAHIAHLTFPSRNPRERFWWSLLPAHVGPVARKAPAWVFEGFATLVEGRLTGSGRPHSAGRAAILREWALSGRLPAYAALDNASTFYGGAMRYLLGSAFLEWLTERKGEASLRNVWLRMSARQSRSFAQAFAGVYGAPPDELYGEFVVQLTERALLVRDVVRATPAIEGELFQRLTWATGEPAVSPDGAHLAVSLRSPGQPPRLVVWRTDAAGVDSALLRTRARILERDPLDVAPFDSFPLPRRAVATLRAVAGAGYHNPRWLPNGEEILVTRDVALGDGASRPDVFVWSWKSGRIRRVTHAAGIRFADPDASGRRAVASRCANGRCGLALVDLASGAVTQVQPGAFSETWHRPRWSHVHGRIAASVHRDGRWQIAVLTTPDAAVSYIANGDSASRHSPAWSGDNLVVVSDRSGIPNLEMLDPEGGVHSVTHTLGAVSAPDVASRDSAVWYLDLHAKGLDVRRYAGRVPAGAPEFVLPDTLSPVLPVRRRPGFVFDSIAVQSRAYGAGPRRWRYFAGGGGGADGGYASLVLANYDPVGKLGGTVQGAFGHRRAWRGTSLGMAWRGWRFAELGAAAFATHLGAPTGAHNPSFNGAALTLERTFDYGASAWSWHLTGSSAQVDLADSLVFDRSQALAEVRVLWRKSHGFWRAFQVQGHGSHGASGQLQVTRGVASLGTLSAWGPLRMRLTAAGGRAETDSDSGGVAAFERFSIGGLEPPLFDERLLPQRIAQPALRSGTASGKSYASYRASITSSGMPLALYAAWFKVYDPNGTWQRLIGAEGSQRFSAIGFASLPNVSLSYGVAYTLDEPRRRRWTLYGGARYAP